MRLPLMAWFGLLLLVTPAWASPQVALMGGLSKERSDNLSPADGGGTGGLVRLPILVSFGESIRLRSDAAWRWSSVPARVTWDDLIDGLPIKLYDDGVGTVSMASLAMGIDVLVPIRWCSPYLGISAGAGVVGLSLRSATFQSIGSQLDEQVTSSVSPLAEVRLGIEKQISDAVALSLEMGYSTALLSESSLSGIEGVSTVQRETIGLNPISVTLGLKLSPREH